MTRSSLARCDLSLANLGEKKKRLFMRHVEYDEFNLDSLLVTYIRSMQTCKYEIARFVVCALLTARFSCNIRAIRQMSRDYTVSVSCSFLARNI